MEPDDASFNANYRVGRGAKSFDHELSHLLYTVISILKGKDFRVDDQHNIEAVPEGSADIVQHKHDLKKLGIEAIKIDCNPPI